ncbi:hypothetical protein HNQ07_001531 [Deinococcus metalli]|uniref:Uncharacterized protein n=1 Tax=Deinococcus metalli TaxID=1141878 RepID=A0A7W8KDC1_9DEIO|nr:hypothetical protein [Deinococcus metalli]MBB5376074.1 hypothetical protein [Deinococcus metalli]GHF41003.1 hypothetical protein GCM10017781_17090 [Deinococcus metalli]
MSDHTPEITLRGAWRGQPGDPDRVFHGTVVHSDHPDSPVGGPCRVTYEASLQRVTAPGDHGRYVLHIGDTERGIVLARFTSAAASSAHAHDEALDDDWYALPAHT